MNVSQSSTSTTDEKPVERRPRMVQKKQVRKTMTEIAGIKKANAQEGYQSSDYDYLTENEYLRYEFNSKQIAHAVITTDESGNLTAQQYDLPPATQPYTPIVNRLTGIEAILRNGKTHYQGTDLNGKKYYSKRSLQAVINHANVDIAYFSEEEEPDHEPEWDNNDEIAIFRQDVNLPELPKKIKGGHKMVINPEAVSYRDANKNRDIDQNTVMGMDVEKNKSGVLPVNAKTEPSKPNKSSLSATKVYEDYYHAMKHALTQEAGELFQRAFNADLHAAPENQYRPEWLHTYAYSLTPADTNPQLAENLGAAGKWVNTEMMVLERIAKWFAINQTNIDITIVSAFEMIRDSEIIGSVHYELTLELLNKRIQFILDVNAFRKNPSFRKATDMAQATGIGYAILHGQNPASSVTITPGPTEETITHKYEGEPLPGSYVDIEETILKTLALTTINTDSSEPAEKKLKTEDNLSRWHLKNNFFAPPVPAHIDSKYENATIGDLETTGCSADKHEILEIALISFSYSPENYKVSGIVGHYHALNAPTQPIPAAITKLTTITDAMVEGQKIDWDFVSKILQGSDFMICHNSKFDRKFFELQTPENIRTAVRAKPFACTYKDIDWASRGFESGKLAFLNKKMGFPFIGHRAMKDCWATLNLLIQNPTALRELIMNMKKETAIGVTNPPSEKKELLKEWGYQWSTGKNTRLPKGWWIRLENKYVEDEKAWLNQTILNPQENKKQKGSVETHDAALDRYAPTMRL